VVGGFVEACVVGGYVVGGFVEACVVGGYVVGGLVVLCVVGACVLTCRAFSRRDADAPTESGPRMDSRLRGGLTETDEADNNKEAKL
jgi:hypothetical protein